MTTITNMDNKTDFDKQTSTSMTSASSGKEITIEKWLNMEQIDRYTYKFEETEYNMIEINEKREKNKGLTETEKVLSNFVFFITFWGITYLSDKAILREFIVNHYRKFNILKNFQNLFYFDKNKKQLVNY